MIDANEFKEKWESELDEYDEGLIVCKDDCQLLELLPAKVKNFLLASGLPDSAAPFLSFDQIRDSGLKKIYEIWGTPSDFSDLEKLRLDSFYVFGNDGCGNPIAFDNSKDFQIVLLDHDDWFNTVTFVSSNLFSFAEYLLEIREMINKAHNELSEAELEDEIPSVHKEQLYEKLRKIDSTAIQEGGFWRSEIEVL